MVISLCQCSLYSSSMLLYYNNNQILSHTKLLSNLTINQPGFSFLHQMDIENAHEAEQVLVTFSYGY